MEPSESEESEVTTAPEDPFVVITSASAAEKLVPSGVEGPMPDVPERSREQTVAAGVLETAQIVRIVLTILLLTAFVAWLVLLTTPMPHTVMRHAPVGLHVAFLLLIWLPTIL